jgi:3-oxoacyl-[acyl-carrier protein] reductase
MTINQNFQDKIALITGGASGIGLATAKKLSQYGAIIIIADQNIDNKEKAMNALQTNDNLFLQVDVSKPESVTNMIKEIINKYNRIDILIHSAGIGVEKLFLETTTNEWNKIINIDLSGTFYCAQACAKEMVKQQYGRIVSLASTAGIRGGTGRAAYGAAKGGVIALTKVMAVELAQYNITVNALAPGAIETELVAKMHSAETRKVYKASIPMNRYGTPEETANAAIFLASDNAKYITGQILGVDGGFLSAGIIHGSKKYD